MDRAALELQASQALFDARLLADAVHAPGTWSMRWGTVEVPAERAFSEVGVSFVATFPEICWLNPPAEGVLLLLDGEIRGMRRIDHPGDTMFVIRWDVTMAERESV